MPYDLLQSNQKIYFNYKSVKQMLSKYNTIVRIFYFTLESEFHYDVRQNAYKSSSILNTQFTNHYIAEIILMQGLWGLTFFFIFSWRNLVDCQKWFARKCLVSHAHNYISHFWSWNQTHLVPCTSAADCAVSRSKDIIIVTNL